MITHQQPMGGLNGIDTYSALSTRKG
jgi:hypothetical protein